MLKNYLLLALRNFYRNRGFFLINILGLTIGLTACILIFLVIEFELTFDRMHHDYANIYRVVGHDRSSTGDNEGSLTPYPFIKAFRNDFPEIPLATQMHYAGEGEVRRDDEKFKVEDIVFADSLFFEVFDFEVISGNPKVELGQPGKAFITESLAATLGITDALPARFTVNNDVDIEIVGLLRDAPGNSHIRFSLVISMQSLTPGFVGGFPLDSWTMTSAGYTYIRLPLEVTESEVETRLVSLVKKYFKKEDAERRSFLLQPLSEIHFSTVYTENPGPARNVSFSEIAVMGLLAVFMLAIACINFVNLSTAMGTRKSREVGIRKTLGAARRQLAGYFLAETGVIIMFAVIISLGIAEWVAPWLSGFMDKDFQLNLFSNYTLLIFLAGLVGITTLLAGCYPAFVLSRYSPASVLRGRNASSSGDGAAVRRFLVVCQFLIAQLLIIGTMVISDQMEFFMNKPLGFEKDAVIVFPLPENDKQKLEPLKERLLQHPSVTSASFSIGAPTSDNNFGTSLFRSDDPDGELYSTQVKAVDIDYLETYGLDLVAGRWFTESDEKMAESSLPFNERHFVYIVNEACAKSLGYANAEDIVGQRITTGVNRITAEVMGVVKDFHVTSLHNAIGPVVLLNLPDFFFEGGIKVNGSDLSGVIDHVKEQWLNTYPDYYFEYEFLDRNLERLYRQDQRTLTLMRIFSGVSIFVACLGLYGLVSFMASQRLKEVGVRKVMGATVSSILVLFSTGFLKLILVSFVIAAPIAWLLMNQWLENFPYHVSIHWSVYVISLLATVVVSVVTISYRSYRAAAANPADTLRNE